ncbi:MAG: VOC family protein [Acidimicrobiia bacterium]
MAEQIDPFEALRRPVVPRRPRPQFAVVLERRLREELHMPMVDDLTPDDTADEAVRTHGSLGLVHLRASDADRAMAFFGELFGWVGERWASDHVSHYVLNTRVTVRLLDDPNAAPVRPNYVVDDVGMAIAAIEASGGRVSDTDASSDGGGWAYAEDGEGVPLVVYRPSGDSHAESDAPVSGDVGLVFVTEDADAARRFYGTVLGWPFVVPHPGSWYFDTVEHVGVFDEHAAFGTRDPASVVLYLEVPALHPALARLVELGGTSAPAPEEPNMGPYFSVLCTDDQGTRFGLMAQSLDA